MSVDVTGAVATSVTGALRQAAQKTGANFNYLLATARVESNLNPSAQATSSSAGGLFQFLEQTWLTTLKHAGPALGFSRYADAISSNSAGRYEVQNPWLRQQILDLRNDPNANALMAGAFTRWNEDWLVGRLNRVPTEGELYLAHFLGAQGATKLIGLAQSSPQASAAEVFPRAAGANRSIFYNKQGEPRSVAQVYDLMVTRYSLARARGLSAPASAVAARAPPPIAADSSLQRMATPPWMLSAPGSGPPSFTPQAANKDSPVFHGLFHTSDRRNPVAPVVSVLWGSHAVTALATTDAQPSKQEPRGGMFDLFRVNG